MESGLNPTAGSEPAGASSSSLNTSVLPVGTPKTCTQANKVSSTPHTPYCFLNRITLQDWRGEQSEYPIQSLGYSSERQKMQVWNTSGYEVSWFLGKSCYSWARPYPSSVSVSSWASPILPLGGVQGFEMAHTGSCLYCISAFQWGQDLTAYTEPFKAWTPSALQRAQGIFSWHKEVTLGMIWNSAVDFNGSPTRKACLESGLGASFPLGVGSHTNMLKKWKNTCSKQKLNS